jgi:hypothetical protein
MKFARLDARLMADREERAGVGYGLTGGVSPGAGAQGTKDGPLGVGPIPVLSEPLGSSIAYHGSAGSALCRARGAPLLLGEGVLRHFTALQANVRYVVIVPSPLPAAWRRLTLVGGISGLACVVLIFVPLIAGTGLEPDFRGSTEEVMAFLRSVSSPIHGFRTFVFVVGLFAFLWFAISLALLLRRMEGDPPWRSAIAAASGLVLVALILVGTWEAATLRADDIDPQVARYAFDLGNATFANAWVALGSFAATAGWVIISTRVFPRWLGWWALVSGVGLVLVRAVWTSQIWLLPYLLFWVWVIVLSVLLVMGRMRWPAELAPSAGPGETLT